MFFQINHHMDVLISLFIFENLKIITIVREVMIFIVECLLPDARI